MSTAVPTESKELAGMPRGCATPGREYRVLVSGRGRERLCTFPLPDTASQSDTGESKLPQGDVTPSHSGIWIMSIGHGPANQQCGSPPGDHALPIKYI